METRISELGWIIIGLVLFSVVALNLWLFTALRRKPGQHSPPRRDTTFQRMQKTIQRPWHVEEDMLKELSERVNDLQPAATNDNLGEKSERD
jgi:hypothetical protein